MTERTIQIQIPEHLKTEEGVARLERAKLAVSNADQRCFELLRELHEQDVLNARALRAALKQDHYYQENPSEVDEQVEYFVTAIQEVLDGRQAASNELGNALIGRK